MWNDLAWRVMEITWIWRKHLRESDKLRRHDLWPGRDPYLMFGRLIQMWRRARSHTFRFALPIALGDKCALNETYRSNFSFAYSMSRCECFKGDRGPWKCAGFWSQAPMQFWILHADLTIHVIFFSYITVGCSIVGFTLHADYRIKKWQYKLHSAWKWHAKYILSMPFVVFFNRGVFVFIWRILLQMDFRHNLRVFCMQFSHVKMGSNAVWLFVWLWNSCKIAKHRHYHFKCRSAPLVWKLRKLTTVSVTDVVNSPRGRFPRISTFVFNIFHLCV